MPWKSIEAYGLAIANFDAKGKQQAPLTVGDEIRLTDEHESGWLRGVVLTTNKRGIFPRNHVHVVPELCRHDDESVTELHQSMREWGRLLRSFYREHKLSEYKLMKERLSALFNMYGQMRSLDLVRDARVRDQLRQKLVAKVEEGRRVMGLDLIVRTPDGEIASEEGGVIELLRLHRAASSDAGGGKYDQSTVRISPSASAHTLVGHTTQQQSPTLTGSYTSATGQRKRGLAPLQSGGLATRTDVLRAVRRGKEEPRHLLVDVKAFMCSVGEASQLLFSVWNRTAQRQLSEEWQVKMTGQGMPEDIERIGQLRVVFRDLPARDFEIASQELFLICRIVRRGKLKAQKKDKKAVDYRRPFAAAVLTLAGLNAREKEQIVPILASPNEEGFVQLPDSIVRGSGTVPVARAMGLSLGARILTGPLPPLLLEETHSGFAASPQECQYLSLECLVGPYGLVEGQLLPGEARHDLYVMLESAEIVPESKVLAPGSVSNKQMSIEVLVKVRSEAGLFLTECLSLGRGEKLTSEVRSLVFLHNNVPKFAETVYVSLKPEQVSVCHLYFEFRKATSKDKEPPAFAVSFMRLTRLDGTFVPEGSMSLPTLRPSTLENEPWYLRNVDAKQQRPKESLKWRTVPTQLNELLNRLTFVDTVEIVRFLPEILSALFAIIESGEAQLGYDALTHVLSLLVEAKTYNYRPVVDFYVSHLFSSSAVHAPLVRCLTRCLHLPDGQAQKHTIAALKALEYIFKLVIASRLKSNERDSPQFKQQLVESFAAFNNLMACRQAALIGAQVIALKSFSDWFNDLGKILDVKEMANVAVKFLDAVHEGLEAGDKKGRNVSMEKLAVLRHLSEGPLLADETSRKVLLPVIVRAVRAKLRDPLPEELDECTQLLLDLLAALERRPAEIRSKELAIFLEILPAQMELLVRGNTTPEQRTGLGAAFLCSLHLADEPQLDHVLASIADVIARQNFVRNFVATLDALVQQPPFPARWLVLTMFGFTVVLRVASHFIDLFLGNTQRWGDVDVKLWLVFFNLCMSFLRARALQLETFSPTKRDVMLRQYGDLRLAAAALISRLWEAYETQGADVTPDIALAALQVVQINEKATREEGASLFIRLLDRELNEDPSLARLLRMTIDAFDTLFLQQGELDNEAFARYFMQRLERRFESLPEFADVGMTFLGSVAELLSLMDALHTLPNTPAYVDDRTLATLRLMDYLKQAGRIDSYLRYVHQLEALHLRAAHYVEAGLTILLHASLLGWRPDSDLPARDEWPAQSEFERKAALYRRSIENLQRGQSFERASEQIEEMKTVLFDYRTAASLLELQAQCCRSIGGTERVFPEFFRVAYYGQEWPVSLRNREFVYRGDQFERIADFQSRILSHFPRAHLLKYTEPPAPEVMAEEAQYLQLFIVRPSSHEEVHGEQRIFPEKMPPQLRKYHEYNNVNIFSYQKPFKKGMTDPKDKNEHKYLHMLYSFFETADKFPTVQQRSEVIRRSEYEYGPLENAIRAIDSKMQELLSIMAKVQRDSTQLKTLTQILQGLIDPSVNGGLKNYTDAFFTVEYLNSNPDKRAQVTKLRDVVHAIADASARGLRLHGQLCSQEVRPMQELLERAMENLQSSLAKL